MFRVLDKDERHSASLAGRKAATLARLASSGFRVPRFAVVVLEPGQGPDGVPLEALAAEGIGPGPYAVRSSAREEDGATDSHAGLYTTCLGVPRDALGKSIRAVAGSGGRALADYRAARGLGACSAAAGVIVQRMVDADAAGVAFGADPVSGRRDVAVVAAVAGLGDALVGGDESGDTWRVDAAGAVTAAGDGGRRPCLRPRQVRAIARLARRVSRHEGRPQDIEWAIRGRRLYLLQSRDITSLPEDPRTLPHALWDNSNIVESYGGVTSPMTFSIARAAYADAYRHLGRAIGVPERTIAAHDDVYEHLLGLIDGRVYYDLLNWYRLLRLVPGFRYNRRFMEQMMGVTAGLPEDLRPAGPRTGIARALRGALGMARIGWRLSRRRLRHARCVRAFHREMDTILAPVALDTMSLEELLRYYDRLQGRVLPAWDTPLLNDLYCMIFHGLLRHLCERWLPADMAAIHGDLVQGGAGLVSLEPLQRMRIMAAIARNDPGLRQALSRDSDSACLAAARGHPAFARALADYLDAFGDRCVDELKLESPTLADDPLPLLRAVGRLAAGAAAEPAGDDRQAVATRRIRRALVRKPLRRRVLGIVARLAAAAVRDRENLRFERTRVYGRVRAILVAAGKRLADAGLIQDAGDVFYLEITELREVAGATAPADTLAAMAAHRRDRFTAYRQGPSPPRRFLTVGPPDVPGNRQAIADPAAGDSTQGCSPGVARGPVRVVRDPRNVCLEPGAILIAERTDPGWVTLFPAAAGLVMERGSPLSHTAIVARELGLPCVVGVDGACDRYADGEWVEIDGSSGTVRRLHGPAGAAA